jgi:endonuclease-3
VRAKTKPGGLRSRIRSISELLEKRYGIPERREKSDPLATLVQTLLSQNTTDRNRDLAYGRLRSRFPRWEDILRAKRGRLVEAIRPGGLAEQKSQRIRDLLEWIKNRQGSLDLAFLEGISSPEIEKTLGGLKGMGPKTLHCLLLFGLGREAFPVDTHVLRVGKRLGFIPERLDAPKAHAWMAPLVPKGKSLSLHLNLIRFGREVCKARAPRCDHCFLTKSCSFIK